MTITIAPVQITPRPGAEPVEYAVEVSPTAVVARYRSLLWPDETYTVVEADVHAGEIFNIRWRHQWALIGPTRLRAELLAEMRALASPGS